VRPLRRRSQRCRHAATPIPPPSPPPPLPAPSPPPPFYTTSAPPRRILNSIHQSQLSSSPAAAATTARRHNAVAAAAACTASAAAPCNPPSQNPPIFLSLFWKPSCMLSAPHVPARPSLHPKVQREPGNPGLPAPQRSSEEKRAARACARLQMQNLHTSLLLGRLLLFEPGSSILLSAWGGVRAHSL